jgi:hypothetical protein
MEESENSYKEIPSCLELVALPEKPLQPKKPVKRPPSYSDSFYILNQGSSSIFELVDTSIPPAPVIQNPELPEVPKNNLKNNSWIRVGLSFLFHITLISMFESIFFYYFISKSEDKGITTTVNNLLNGITASCPLSANQTVFWHDVFHLLVNTTSLQSAAIMAADQRAVYNSGIFLQSWMYVVGISGITAVAFVVAAFRKVLDKRTLTHILAENVGLVAMLGCYEFLFFRTIIYQYDSISVLEIEQYIVNTLQNQCGI